MIKRSLVEASMGLTLPFFYLDCTFIQHLDIPRTIRSPTLFIGTDLRRSLRARSESHVHDLG